MIGYCRVSDKEQVKKGFSIEAQQESIEQWCLENNHDLATIYVEPGRSGSKKATEVTRPAFKRAVSFVLAGSADGLVVKWIDRFARNVEDFLRIRSEFYQAEKYLISINEPLLNGDPSDPIARYISTAIMNAYQLQAELSGLKAAQGRERRARQGQYPGSLPLGYTRKNKQISIDKIGGHQIETAFFEFSTGKWTLESWQQEAKERGYQTKRGNDIAKSGWHRIFRNTFYVGRYTWKGIEYEGDYPPLVSEDVFQSVQDILDQSGPSPGAKKHFWLLGGLLWSDVHQKLMIGAQIKGQFNYYRATDKGRREHNVKADEIEQRVIDLLCDVSFSGGDCFHFPDTWQLAVRISPNMRLFYDNLSTKFERRELLRLIFATRGITVSSGGLILGVKYRAGFQS